MTCRRPSLLLIPPAVLALVACSGQTDTLTYVSSSGLAIPLASMSDCPTLTSNVTLTSPQTGAVIIDKICIKDDQGHYYASGLSDGPSVPIPVVPAGRTYAVVYEFRDGFVPDLSHAAEASVAYVAPDNVDCGGFPEDSASNAVPIATTLEGQQLTQSLTEVVTSGRQVVPWLRMEPLLPSVFKGAWNQNGMNIRFYVGAQPACVHASGDAGCAGDACPP